MATKYHQISLSDFFSDCQNIFIDDPPSFFSLLSEHFDLNEFIPPEFFTAFYRSIGVSYFFHSSEDFFHSYRLPASAFFTFMQRIKRVLWFHQGS